MLWQWSEGSISKMSCLTVFCVGWVYTKHTAKKCKRGSRWNVLLNIWRIYWNIFNTQFSQHHFVFDWIIYVYVCKYVFSFSLFINLLLSIYINKWVIWSKMSENGENSWRQHCQISFFVNSPEIFICQREREQKIFTLRR